MKAKFKVGDRVVVRDICRRSMGYSVESDKFNGESGMIAGVFTYVGLQADYDVIMDGHEAQGTEIIHGFLEEDLIPEEL